MINDNPQIISARDALQILATTPVRAACLDVRSEDEFSRGSIPNFKNVPILSDHERHLVGLCYKEKGQAEAVALGHNLVLPHKDQLVEHWCKHLASADLQIVTCWRGGLRSQIAAQWISHAGIRATRIEGGSKALRNELLQEFAKLPELIVIAGPTGSRKTKLLNNLRTRKIDLEALAQHRGSAFGRNLLIPQPSQTTFENSLAFELLRDKNRILFLENESKAIGSVYLPLTLLDKINKSPIVRILMDLEERAAHILDDYIVSPLQSGVSNEQLQAYYEESLTKIKSKLGGLKENQLRTTIRESFLAKDLNAHKEWIRELLVHYYDKTYEHSFNRTSHPIAFEGDWDSCLSWIQNQYA